jgi:hypothetical protein
MTAVWKGREEGAREGEGVSYITMAIAEVS